MADYNDLLSDIAASPKGLPPKMFLFATRAAAEQLRVDFERTFTYRAPAIFEHDPVQGVHMFAVDATGLPLDGWAFIAGYMAGRNSKT
jgi:hypothetical protein